MHAHDMSGMGRAETTALLQRSFLEFIMGHTWTFHDTCIELVIDCIAIFPPKGFMLFHTPVGGTGYIHKSCQLGFIPLNIFSLVPFRIRT